MLQSEIVAGGRYLAKVSDTVTIVRVDRIEQVAGRSSIYRDTRATTRYHVTNERTGRVTVFKSAARFRRSAAGFAITRDGKLYKQGAMPNVASN